MEISNKLGCAGKSKLARSANFSSRETHILVSLVNKFKRVIECKESDTTSIKKKNAAWQALCKEFNGASGEIPRDVVALKNKYTNLKKRAKGNFAQERNYLFGTGGGPSEESPVTEIDQQIKDIIGKQVTGDAPIFDSDVVVNITEELNSQEEQTIAKEPNETITIEIADDVKLADLAKDLGDDFLENVELQENVGSQWAHYSPATLRTKKSAALSTGRSVEKQFTLKNKLTQWSAEKAAAANLQRKNLDEEHKQKLRHNQEKHDKYIEECNLRMRHMQEKHDLELALMKAEKENCK